MKKGYRITITCLVLTLGVLCGLIYFDLFHDNQSKKEQAAVDMSDFQQVMQAVEDSRVLGNHLWIQTDLQGEPTLFRYDQPLDFSVDILKANKSALLCADLTTEHVTHSGYYELYYEDGWQLTLTDGKPVMFIEKTVYHYENMDDIDAIFRVADHNAHPDSDQLNVVKTILQQRLTAKNIGEYDIRVDTANGKIHLRFPWTDTTQAGINKILAELTVKGMLEFYEGEGTTNRYGEPTPPTNGMLILNGYDVVNATVAYTANAADPNRPYTIALELTEAGAAKFSEATTRLAAKKGMISIWMDYGAEWAQNEIEPQYQQLVTPVVESPITDGNAIITGFASFEDAKTVADLINSEPLPFEIEVAHVSLIKAEDK